MLEFDKIQNIDNAADNVLWYSYITLFKNMYGDILSKEEYELYKFTIDKNILRAFYYIHLDYGRKNIGETQICKIDFEFLNTEDFKINIYIKYFDEGDEFKVVFKRIEHFIKHLQTNLNINKVYFPDDVVLTYDGDYKFDKLYKVVEPQIKNIYIHTQLNVLSLIKNNRFIEFCREKHINIVTPYFSGFRKNVGMSRYSAKIRHQDYDERHAMNFTDTRIDPNSSSTITEIYEIQ